jgi:predicted DNA-binding transcriptional regulator YafY
MLEQTDSSSGITLGAISRELEKYGIRAERKTLYDDIETLRVYGVDIQTQRSKGVKYCLCERPISPLAAKIICDALGESHALSDKEKTELMGKIVLLGGKNIRPLLEDKASERNVYDRDICTNLSILSEAITTERCVSCRCFTWNSRKQRIMNFDGEYLKLSPWKLTFGERPILVAYDHASKKMLQLRADRLINLAIMNLPREGAGIYSEFSENEIARSPKEVMMRFCCANSIADEVISRFGTDITVFNNTEDHFEFSVKSVPDESLYFWLFVNSDTVRLLSPENILNEYRQAILAAASGLENK